MVRKILFSIIIFLVSYLGHAQSTQIKYDCNPANNDSVYVTITEPSCFGVFDGEVQVEFIPDESLNPIDQTMMLNSYTVAGSNNGFQNIQNNQLTATFSNLQPDVGMVGFVQMKEATGFSFRLCSIGPFTVDSVPQSSSPPISGPIEICEDAENVVYRIEPNAGATYSWYNVQGDAVISSATNLDSIVVNFGSSDARFGLKERSSKGCNADTSIINVTVNPTPSAPTVSGNNALCANTTGESYSVSGDPASNFYWSVEGASLVSASGQNATIDFGTTNATIKVVEESTSGCFSDTSVFNVAIESLPASTSLSGASVVCENTTGETYTASGSSGNTFNWLVNGATASSTTGSSITVDFASSDAEIQVIESSSSGCVGDTADLNVTVVTKPIPVISGTTEVCEGASAEPYSVTGRAGSSFNWSVSNAVASSATAQNITIDFGASNAVLTVVETPTGVAGCSSDPVNYPVNVLAKPATALAGPTTVCANSQNINYAASGSAGSSYSWSVNGATITSDNGDNIDVDFSTGNTIVKVIEQNAAGCFGDTVRLNVSVESLPASTGISGTPTVCENTTNETYTVSGDAGSSFNWIVSGASASSTMGTSITVDFASVDAEIQVIESSSSGCAGDTATFAVDVITKPVPVITGASEVCRGTSGEPYVATGRAGSSFSWAVSNAVPSSTSTPNITVDFGASDAVLTVVEIPSGVTGCNSDPVNFPVDVLPLPNTSISGTAVVCANTNGVNYTANGTAGSSYTWVVNGASIVSDNGDNIDVNFGSSNATIKVVEETASGCIGDTARINVSTQPLPTSTSISGPSVVCSNPTTEVYTVSGNAGSTFNWSVTGATASATTGNSISVEFGASDATITVIETSSAGCPGNAITRNVNVIVKPTPSISGANTVCAGTKGEVFTANGTAGSSFNWVIEGALPATANTANVSVNFASTDAVLKLVETPAGGASCKSDTVSLAVDVVSKPATSLSGPSTICAESQSVNYAASGFAGSTYDWVVSGASIAANNGDNIDVDFTNTNATIKVLEQGTVCPGDTQTIIVNVNPVPIVSNNGNQVICAGDSVLLSASGANAYSWTPATGLLSPGSASTYAKPSTTTIYSVVGTNGFGCSDTTDLTVTVNPVPVASVSPLNPTICAGQSVGLSASGGSAYQWSPAAGLSNPNVANPTASPVSTTTYKVRVFNASGCTDSATVTVNVNPVPTVNATASPSTICFGETIQLNTSTDPSYTYSWTPAGSLNSSSVANPIASPASTTNYSVTVDNGACSATGNVSVTVNALPVAGISPSPSDTICKNESINLSATGGVNYSWSPASLVDNPNSANTVANPVSDTEFTVTVESANGCIDSAKTTIYIEPVININITGGDSICRGDVTTLSATASNMSSFSWSPSATLADPNSLTTQASPLTTTTYVLTVQNSIGCENSDSIEVIVLQPAPVTVTPDQTICNEDTVLLTATTGVAGYTYSWTPVAGLENPGQASTNAFPTSTTTYEVTASSPAGGCDSKASVTVNVNPLPNLTLTPDQTICLGDSVTLNVSGATSYSWSPNTNITSSNGNSTEVFPTSDTYYYVDATDGNGCSARDSVLISVNPVPNVSAGTDIEICAGASVQLDGNPGGLTSYTWSPAVSISNPNVEDPTVSPASDQEYILTGTAANGCSAMDTVLVSVVVNPAFTVSGTDSICAGDTTQLTVNTSLGNTVTWSPNTGIDDVTSLSPNFFPSASRTYKLVVSNFTGCKDSTLIDIKVNPLPTITASPNTEVCIGSSTTINAIGGDTYVWSPTATLSASTGASVNASPSSDQYYKVTGTDLRGCYNTDSVLVSVNPLPSVSAGTDQTICEGTTAQLNGLPNGLASYSWTPAASLSSVNTQNPVASPLTNETYILTGVDANGCSNSDTVNVSVTDAPDFTISGTDSLCLGASTQLSVSTDAANTVTWSPATGIDDVNALNPVFSPISNTTYTLVVMNATGCKDSASVEIKVNPLPNVAVNPTSDVCLGSSITLNAIGAESYVWSPSAELSATTGDNVIATPTTTKYFKVTGTDEKGCSNVDSVEVTVNPLPLVDAGTDAEICKGSSVQLNGAPFGLASYTWSPSTSLSNANVANPIASPLTTRDYVLLGEDANGCQNRDTVQVSVITIPPLDISQDTSICLGTSTMLSVTTDPANTVTWTPNVAIDDVNSSSPTVSPTTNQVYKVVVENPTGCKDSADVQVSIDPLPNVSLSANTEICLGTSSNLVASGGISYDWSPAAGLSATTGSAVVATPASTQYYKVEVTDANGCVNADSVEITVNPLPVVTAGTDAEICRGTSVELNGGPSGLVSYSWSPAASLSNPNIANPVASPLADTDYILTGQDANGCQNTDTVNVSVITIPPITTSPDAEICIGNSTTLSVTTDASNTVEWKPNVAIDDVTSRNPVVNPVADEVYTVVVGNPTGCKDSAEVSVTVNPLPTVGLSATPELCLGNSTVINATGGVNYNWSPAAGLSATSGSSVTATPTQTRFYTVEVTDANGCVNQDSIEITVNPLPLVSAGNDKVICVGDTVQLDGASGFNAYNWSPVASLDNPASATPNAFPEITTDYILQAEDANGCQNTDTVQVVVNELPTFETISDTSICSGASIELSVTTASTNMISWSAGTPLPSPNPTETPTTDQVYKVIVENPEGCKDSATVIINLIPLPEGTAVFDKDPLCFEESTTLNLSLNSGYVQNPAGSFSLNGSPFTNVNTFNYTGINSGDSTINITYRDNNNCSSVNESVSIRTLEELTFDANVLQEPSCTVSEGTVEVTNIAGGLSPYTISDGTTTVVATSNTFSNLPVGTHTFTVTGDNGCIASETINFTGPISFDSTLTDPLCYGSADGTISVNNVTGGVAPYEFSLNNNTSYSSNSNYSGLTAGIYTVFIKDDSDCELPIEFTLTNPDSISILQLAKNDILCTGDTGTATYEISGGTGVLNITQGSDAYTGEGTYTFEAYSGGTYSINVTDANACTKAIDFVINEEKAMETYLSLVKQADCNVASGIAQIDSTVGGSGDFLYGFAGAASLKDSASFANDLTTLNSGIYQVITEDVNYGCLDTATVSVTRTAGIDVDQIATDITPSCTNADGIIALSNISGAAPRPYEFQLVDFVSGDTIISRQTDSTFTGVSPGNYKVVIYDNLDCPEELAVNLPFSTGLNVAVDTTDETCNLANGEFELTISGGNAPYFTSLNTKDDFDAQLTYSGLSAGMYKVYLQDNSTQTCTDSVEIEIENVIQKPTGSISITSDTVCFGETVTVTSQLDPALIPNPNGSYSYDKGATFSPVTSFDYDAKEAGDTTFHVVFRDAINCVLSDTFSVSLHITEPLDLTIAVIDTPTCTVPGTIQVNNFSGGTPPYMFEINNGGFEPAKDTTLSNLGPGIYSVTLQDEKLCSYTERVDLSGVLTYDLDFTEPTCFGDTTGAIAISNVSGAQAPYEFSFNNNTSYATDSTFGDLGAGTYVIYVRDDAGCEIPVSVTLTQPDSLFISEISRQDIGCEDEFGALTVQVQGGTEPLTVSFTDTTGTGAGTYAFANLNAGMDTVFVVDDRGCANDYPFEIIEVPNITTYISQTQQGECNKTVGKAAIDSTIGGSGAYGYRYSSASAFLNKGDMETEMDSLATGIYVVITKDNVFNCLDTTTFSINRKSGVDSIDVFSFNSCNNVDGYMEVTDIHGSAPAPFTFELRDGFNPDSVIYDQQTDSLFSDLSGGSYIVSVYDALNCREDFVKRVSPPNPLLLNYTVNPDSCGDTTGAIYLEDFANGNEPYEFSFENQMNFGSETSFENLVGGIYTIYMRDSSDPRCTNGFEIDVPSQLISVRDTVIDATCYGGSNGIYEFFTVFNTDTAKYDYRYSLDPTAAIFGTDSIFMQLDTGSYSLFVKQTNKTTGNACIYAAWRREHVYDEITGERIDALSRSQTWFDVEDGEEIFITYDSLASEFEEPTGSIIIENIDGGEEPYQVRLDTNEFVDYGFPTEFTGLGQTVTRDKSPYEITILDALGCITEFTVNVPSEFYVPNVFTPNGDGTNDTFFLMGLEPYTRVRIYDRWGTLAYENNNYQNQWDGGKDPDGTYFYEITLPDRTIVSGWVQIVR